MNLKLYLIAATFCFSVNNNLTASTFEKEANIEAKDERGRTALHHASINGHKDERSIG